MVLDTRVRFQVEPRRIEARPGEPVTIDLTMVNTTAVLDTFEIALVGLDRAAVQVEPALVSLTPGESATATLDVTLPGTIPSGTHVLGVKVVALEEKRVWFEDVELHVPDMSGARLDVQPERIKGRLRGRTKVELHNLGQVPLDFAMQGTDPEDDLRLSFRPATVTVPPDGVEVVDCRVTARPKVFGVSTPHVTDVVAQGPGKPLQATVTFTHQPLIAMWFLKMLLIVALLVAGLFVLRYLVQGYVDDRSPKDWQSIDGSSSLVTGSGLEPRIGHTAVWVEFERFVVPDSQGNPITRVWGRFTDWMVGRDDSVEGMIIWGGDNRIRTFDDGAIYAVEERRWESAPGLANPDVVGRTGHSAVWTGDAMIVWGGSSLQRGTASILGGGSRYQPSLDKWDQLVPPSACGAAGFRSDHTAVWTGRFMLVFGGETPNGLSASGLAFRPQPSESVPAGPPPTGCSGRPGALTAADSWTRVPAPDPAFSPRRGHSAVWTGNEMIVWGGWDGAAVLADGARYDPETGAWTPVSLTRALDARTDHTALWTGEEMLVVGGVDADGIPVEGGAAYDPAEDTWRPLLQLPPHLGTNFAARWTRDEVTFVIGSPELDTVTAVRYEPTSGDEGVEILGPPSSPATAPFRTGFTSIWINGGIVIWGGALPDGTPTDNGALLPLADR